MLDLSEEAALHVALGALADAGLMRSCSDISDGGCAVALARACFAHGFGIDVAMQLKTDHAEQVPFLIRERLFSEIPSSVILSVAFEKVARMQSLLKEHPKLWLAPLGSVTGDHYTIRINGKLVIDEPLAELMGVWSAGLEDALQDEVYA